MMMCAPLGFSKAYSATYYLGEVDVASLPMQGVALGLGRRRYSLPMQKLPSKLLRQTKMHACPAHEASSRIALEISPAAVSPRHVYLNTYIETLPLEVKPVLLLVKRH
jgi:hypothetical protein